MRGYLLRKVEVQRRSIAWTKEQVTRLLEVRPEHRQLCAKLLERSDEAERDINQLEAIAKQDNDVLNRGARPLLHRVEWVIHILTCRFIPALERQLDGDRWMRRVLLAAVQGSGMNWIGDLAIRLDGPHASFPVIPGTPLLFGPANQTTTLVGMPAFYHELGHSLFEASDINSVLRDTARGHFKNLADQAGPLSPANRLTRNSALRSASDYWSRPRLNELFGDVFAIYTCGPAYLATCVDLGLASKRNPYAVESDVHPPWGARVRICYEALHPSHRDTKVVRLTMETWDEHAAGHQPGADFELTCPQELVGPLVGRALKCIQESAPTCTRFVSDLNGSSGASGDRAGSLASILNRGLTVLIEEPKRFNQFESEALSRIPIVAE